MQLLHGKVLRSDRGGWECDLFWEDSILTSQETYPAEGLARNALENHLALCRWRFAQVPVQILLLRLVATPPLILRRLSEYAYAYESQTNHRSSNFWVNPLRDLGWQAALPDMEAALRDLFTYTPAEAALVNDLASRFGLWVDEVIQPLAVQSG